MEIKNSMSDDANAIILNGDSVENDLEIVSKYYKQNNNRSINIYISNEKDFTEKRLENITKVLKILSKQNKDIAVTIVSNTEKRNVQTNTPYVYTNKEINRLINFNNSLKNIGLKEIKFSENFCETWSLNTVLDANSKLNLIVEKLKKANLSPYETMLAIHKIVSNIAYQDSKTNSAESPRSITGIFSNGDIVCVGYSHLVKAIIDKLDMKGLKAEINIYSLYGKQMGYFAGGHANNQIFIDDEKYNIKGSFVEDSCWDSKNDKINTSRGFAHCMYLQSDIKNLKSYFVEQNNGLSMKELDIGFTLSSWRYGEEDDYDRVIIPESRFNAPEGKQISLETFKLAYKNMLLKMAKDKNADNIEKDVEKAVEISAKHSLDTFAECAQNNFVKEAIDKKYIPLKQELTNNTNVLIN